MGVVLLAWEGVTSTGMVSPWLLPRLGAVWPQLRRVVTSGDLLPDIAITLYQLGVAVLIAAAAGIVLGYVIATSERLVRIFEPLFAGFSTIPVVVFYPLCILYLGLGPGSKIVFGALHGFFPILLSTIAGFTTVDRRLIGAARSMGASNAQLLRLVLLPAALPVVLSGLRLGITLTFLAIIGAETLGALAGLGHKVVWAAEAMETPRMFAYIVVVVVVAALLYWGLAQLEKSGGAKQRGARSSRLNSHPRLAGTREPRR